MRSPNALVVVPRARERPAERLVRVVADADKGREAPPRERTLSARYARMDASGRPQGGRRRRASLTRPILLGAVAVVLGLGWLAWELGLDWEVLGEYLLTAMAWLLVPVAMAAAGFGLMLLFRRR